MKLKLRAIGASTGVLLPMAMLTRLKVKKGDTLFAVQTPAGYLLTPYHGDVEKQFGLGRAFMAKYGSVFRVLAR
jgi:putative addiction module antidote